MPSLKTIEKNENKFKRVLRALEVGVVSQPTKEEADLHKLYFKDHEFSTKITVGSVTKWYWYGAASDNYRRLAEFQVCVRTYLKENNLPDFPEAGIVEDVYYGPWMDKLLAEFGLTRAQVSIPHLR